MEFFHAAFLVNNTINESAFGYRFETRFWMDCHRLDALLVQIFSVLQPGIVVAAYPV